MNILFALYHDFRANSAIHVHHFANQLASFGHSVAVAVPERKETGESIGAKSYVAANFPEVDGTWSRLFPDGLPPAVLHAWTPRENVRLFCEKVRGLCAPAVLVHLEDNEELILEVNLGRPFRELEMTPSLKVPNNLSHPRRYRNFLASADGVTMIMDRLEKFVPAETPKLTLWPGADNSTFFPRTNVEALREKFGVPPGHFVLCYTGNVHSANAREVRSLYLAVAMLNREGFPATLVRTGVDHAPFLGEDDRWAREHSIELGYLDQHHEIGDVLALADVLIQPGTDDEFNEYRLPSKLPEFFAMGRPVILPRTNVGRFAEHGRDAWVLPKVDALRIAETLRLFANDPALVRRLSDGAIRFYEEHFSWEKNARQLESFYRQIVNAHGSALPLPS